MNIINDSSLEYLDEMTNGGSIESDKVYVQPAIKDIGDVGIKTGVRF